MSRPITSTFPTREAVEETLEGYEGTILVVSHDRYFLDKVVNRVVEIRNGKLVSFNGNFSEFWHATQSGVSPMAGRVKTRARSRAAARVERAEQRDRVASLERRIAEAEAEKLDLERQATDAFERGQHRRGRRIGRADRAQHRPPRRPLRPVDRREPIAVRPRSVNTVLWTPFIQAFSRKGMRG